jgi:hypothetical protein
MTFDIVWGVYIEVGLLCPKNKGHAVSFGYKLFIAKLKCRDVQNFYANGYAVGLYMEGQP